MDSPQHTQALLALSLREVSDRMARGEVSALELVDASLQRIDDINPSTRAYISVYEQARDVAKAADMLGVTRGTLRKKMQAGQ